MKLWTDDGWRTDDGRMLEHGYTISSPCEPKGSGELKIESLFSNLHDVMKTVVVAKILHEALCASWNFNSAHCLHHIMKVEK